jgi:hypothetical protein
MRDQGVQTVNETEPVDLCELFFKQLGTKNELHELLRLRQIEWMGSEAQSLDKYFST